MSVKVRNINSPYHISKDNKLELEHFCMQYQEWCRELSALNFYQKPSQDHVDTTPGDPVTKLVEKRERLLEKINLVDNCIKEACHEDIGKFIFESVTKKKSYDAIQARSYVPCSRKVFYDERAKFFYILAGYR